MAMTPRPAVYVYRRVVESKLFIDRRFAERIDLDHIAEHACFAKHHFIRLFRKIYGTTPHQYLTLVRLERAKELLGNGQTVTATCFAVGFESMGSFSSLFKRYAGETPSAYQTRLLGTRLAAARTPLRFIPGCFAAHCSFIEESNFQEAIL
jgi:AraC-like DNA-binding protein